MKIKKNSLKSIVLDKKQRNLLQKKKWEKRQKRTAAREWPVMECITDVPSNAWLSWAIGVLTPGESWFKHLIQEQCTRPDSIPRLTINMGP